MMMVASLLIALIAGILLALRFKVFVLVPATLLAAVVIVASSHQPNLTIALTVLDRGAASDRLYCWHRRSRGSAKTLNGASGRFLLKVIRGLWYWRAVGASKKPITTSGEKRHLVQ